MFEKDYYLQFLWQQMAETIGGVSTDRVSHKSQILRSIVYLHP
jgi:hypothetical protein